MINTARTRSHKALEHKAVRDALQVSSSSSSSDDDYDEQQRKWRY